MGAPPAEWYFTYSACTSGAVGGGRGRYETAAQAATHNPIPPPTAPYRLLPSICNPPDPPSVVVTHEQRAVRHHEQPHGTAPARAVGELPAGHEVLDRRGPAALDAHAHHLRAGRDGAVPGAVIRHERIAVVRRRERRARVKREPERRRVGRVRDRRRLDPGAGEARIFRVRLAREVALRPAVPLAVPVDVQVLGGEAVGHRRVGAAYVVAVVVGPQLTRRRMEREPDRVAQPGGERV